MSAEAVAQPVALVATAGPGVAIRISDASLREIGRGADSVTVPAPPGLYMVEWETAGSRQETLLRIEPGAASPRVVNMADVLAPGRPAPDRSLNKRPPPSSRRASRCLGTG